MGVLYKPLKVFTTELILLNIFLKLYIPFKVVVFTTLVDVTLLHEGLYIPFKVVIFTTSIYNLLCYSLLWTIFLKNKRYWVSEKLISMDKSTFCLFRIHYVPNNWHHLLLRRWNNISNNVNELISFTKIRYLYYNSKFFFIPPYRT
jgi:hypothetical protein